MKNDATYPRPVDVVGRLAIDSPAGRVDVEGRGRLIVVRFRRASQAFRAGWKLVRLKREMRHSLFARLRDALNRADVQLRFQIDEREVARVGGPGRPGLVARGLALPGTRVRALGWIPVAGSRNRRERW